MADEGVRPQADEQSLIESWKAEERAPFSGWYFSTLKGRMREEQPPWDYASLARGLFRSIGSRGSALDLGTGGGELLSSLGPFPERTFATEGHPPNVPVAMKRLRPLGVTVVEADSAEKIPFDDETFDVVLSRHSAFCAEEVFRILKRGGVFLTQQVPADNLRDLAGLLGCVRGEESGPSGWSLGQAVSRLEAAGFSLEDSREWKGKAVFLDVGALVYFLKAVPWVVEGFSVERYRDGLLDLQRRIDAGLRLSFTVSRFMLICRKRTSLAFAAKG